MNLENYINENYPEIKKEYARYARKKELPKVGSKVRTLVSGYGGLGGQVFTVKGYTKEGEPTGDGSVWGGNYIDLGGYLCGIENWWKELEIICE